jgi:hypothetical protein
VTGTNALGNYGNIAAGYRGTVHFTSTDAQAVLPANYAFVAADNGVHTFTATLKTAGTQSLTATDTVTSSSMAFKAGSRSIRRPPPPSELPVILRPPSRMSGFTRSAAEGIGEICE